MILKRNRALAEYASHREPACHQWHFWKRAACSAGRNSRGKDHNAVFAEAPPVRVPRRPSSACSSRLNSLYGLFALPLGNTHPLMILPSPCGSTSTP